MTRIAPPMLLLALLAAAALPARAAAPCRPIPLSNECSASPASGKGSLAQCALWYLVNGNCVPHEKGGQGPGKCTSVDLKDGSAVLKDRTGTHQFLLIPTAPVTGIEDSRLLSKGAPNYWDDAWNARTDVDKAMQAHGQLAPGQSVPRDDMSLAVNSLCGRTQDQLHIHVDVLRADVRAELIKHQSAIGDQWADFPVKLGKPAEKYRAMRLLQQDLGTTNLFQLLAQTVPQADMAEHTLVVVGATFAGKPGFILLDGQADMAEHDSGSGEFLQDHFATSAP